MIGPMLLALDVGNTNITLGRVDGGEVVGTRSAPTPPRATPSELERLIGELLGLDDVALDDVGDIVLASVVPTVTAAVIESCAQRGIRLLVAGAETIPMLIRVDRPAEVGADRLVNAFAAARLYGAPVIVVDFGTATTFDVVGADGAFLGGAIAAGLELGVEALASHTAMLPRVPLALPRRAIGTDTVTAMQSGAVIGHIGLVHELLARVQEEVAPLDAAAATVVLTGGLSRAPWAREIFADVIDPDLTLRGLALLHAEVSATAQPTSAA